METVMGLTTQQLANLLKDLPVCGVVSEQGTVIKSVCIHRGKFPTVAIIFEKHALED